MVNLSNIIRLTKLLFNWITFDDLKQQVEDLLYLFYINHTKLSFSTFVVQINEILIKNKEMETKCNLLSNDIELLKKHVFGKK